jgi:hypothetical protein
VNALVSGKEEELHSTAAQNYTAREKQAKELSRSRRNVRRGSVGEARALQLRVGEGDFVANHRFSQFALVVFRGSGCPGVFSHPPF